MTVLLGPNGSGKSTVFDVFAFLAECFGSGLRHAWDRRGRARELMTRGADGPMTIEIKYREQPGEPLITYDLSVEESGGRPVIIHEWMPHLIVRSSHASLRTVRSRCSPISYSFTIRTRRRSSESRSPRISCPQVAERLGRGMPGGIRTHPAAGHDPFPVLHRLAETERGSSAVAGHPRSHPGATGRRSSGYPGVRLGGRPIGRSVDGGPFRGWGSADAAWRSSCRPRLKLETTAKHLEFLIEEPSMEAFLRVALPRMIPSSCSFNIHAFQGKPDLLRKLHQRLRGYRRWIPPSYRIVVLVDRDDQNCHIPRRVGYRDPDAIKGGTWEPELQRPSERPGGGDHPVSTPTSDHFPSPPRLETRPLPR